MQLVGLLDSQAGMREEGGCQEGSDVPCGAVQPTRVRFRQVMALLICRGIYCWNPLKVGMGKPRKHAER